MTILHPSRRTVTVSSTPVLTSKDPAETVFVYFDVSRAIVGETVQSATVSISVHSGEDETPSAVLSGTAVIVDSAGVVKQLVTGGLNGVVYELSCEITTDVQTLDPILARLPIVDN